MNPTLQRLRRLLVMVPWLLDNPGVRVEEAADRFDTTAEAVLDDLDVLGYCGLPGYGGGDLVETSVTGGHITVRLADFFARPLALTVREGIALLLAARATRDSGVLAGEASAPLDTAIAKLEAHLGAEAQLPVGLDVEASGSDLLQQLFPAVTDPHVIDLTYRSASKEEVTTRDVEPWALRSQGGSWYLLGHCRLAGATRAFRLDRIVSARATDEVAPDPPDDVHAALAYEPSEDDPQVIIDVDASAAWITDQIVLDARETLPDGRLRLTFRASTLAWAASLVLRLGGAATVAEPLELIDLVGARARAALARYDLGS